MTFQVQPNTMIPPRMVQSARRPMSASHPASRMLLVDDHAVMREGLKSILRNESTLTIVGEAEDGHAALKACFRLKPDLVLMDLQLPSLDGIDAIAMIRRRWPEIRVVVLAGMHSESRAAQALRAGAHGYVLKRSHPEKLIAALHAVRDDLAYLDPAVNFEQVDAMRKADAADPKSNVAAGLTPRERQVLKLIAEGLSNRKTAERLSISAKTVETHRMNLMRKLDAHNAAELSQWARRLGLVSI
ncbi:two component system response regulator [Cupriavidus respiraculi]|uniref:Transcriptional regulatory protein DegU n=3 Tax=Cupriavidus respiraculi TaxID=195930 RepID=A0ABM8WJJ5_9BURK|nr:Transcriptional regulatory protein DegU [Cupriavidus respiraculi]